MSVVKYIIFLLAISFCVESNGAIFRGRVVDIKGEPLEGASIYIHELRMGVTTDKDGEFSITLAAGKYMCEISSLGYKRTRINIDISSEDIQMKIVLEDEVYELDPAYSRAGKEDRASSVMRKAIARAPYHRAQIRQFEAEAYMKGNIMITKLPRLIQMQAKKNNLDLAVNKRFVAESFSEVTFDYPDKYSETILAANNSIPVDLDVVNLSIFMRYSIYQPEIFGRLSPLAPNAFNHYNFEYMGMVAEDNRLVNKIRVIPRKKKDPKVVSGILYIVEDSWDVLYAEIRASEMGVTLNLKMNYNELIAGVLVPTTYDVDAVVDVMGVEANGKYYSSVTYKIINNIDPKAEVKIAEEVVSLGDLEDDISTRQARRIAAKTENEIKEAIASEQRAQENKEGEERIGVEKEEGTEKVEKAESSPRRDSSGVKAVEKKKSLEVKMEPLITSKLDTLAKIRDEDYWSRVRTIPLKEDEAESYSRRDSLKEKVDRMIEGDSTRFKSTGNQIMDKILYGGRFKIAKNSSIGIGGLIRVVPEFNFVDGYHLGQNIYFQQSFGDYTSFRIEPSLYYTTHRKNLAWDVTSSLIFDPIRRGSLNVSIGEGSADISNSPSMSRSLNTYSASILGISPVKLDQRRYISGTFAIDITNGLRLNTSVALERRSPLSLGNIKSFFGKRPLSNVPHNYLDPLIVMHNSLYYNLSLSYTPEHRYYISDGRKRYLSSKWPTFTLYNRASLAQFNARSSSYGLVGASIRQSVKVGMRSDLKYYLDGGTFYNRKNIYLNDYKFFKATNTIYLSQGFSDSFLMLNHYKYATPKSWLTLSTEYQSDFILLKYLPFINSPLFYESLHLKGLWLPEDKITHFEAGYSAGLMGTVRAGVFVGFDDFKFSGVTFRLEIPFPF